MKSIITMLFCCLFVTAAEAKPHHYQHYARAAHIVRLAGHSATPEYVANEDRFGASAESGTMDYGFHYQISAGYTRGYSGASSGGLSAACREAAREGGPCGCFAQERIFGSDERLYAGHNLWYAPTWPEVFPHVAAAPGTVEVFYGRGGAYHVAEVVAVNGNRVTTSGPEGTYEHAAVGVFVQPSFGYASAR